jgi:hypothetical protein
LTVSRTSSRLCRTSNPIRFQNHGHSFSPLSVLEKPLGLIQGVVVLNDGMLVYFCSESPQASKLSVLPSTIFVSPSISPPSTIHPIPATHATRALTHRLPPTHMHARTHAHARACACARSFVCTHTKTEARTCTCIAVKPSSPHHPAHRTCSLCTSRSRASSERSNYRSLSDSPRPRPRP